MEPDDGPLDGLEGELTVESKIGNDDGHSVGSHDGLVVDPDESAVEGSNDNKAVGFIDGASEGNSVG